MAMVWMARLRARSPPRLSRCRTVRPLLAGSGQVPAREANAASLRQRPGWENETMAWAAASIAAPMSPNTTWLRRLALAIHDAGRALKAIDARFGPATRNSKPIY